MRVEGSGGGLHLLKGNSLERHRESRGGKHIHMKVVLIGLTHPFRGGIAHYTSLLYRELKKKHSVTLISLKKQYPSLLFPGKSQMDESQERIEVENSPMIHPLIPWSWRAAFSRIKTFAPDLTLFQWWHPFFAPSFGTLACVAEEMESDENRLPLPQRETP